MSTVSSSTGSAPQGLPSVATPTQAQTASGYLTNGLASGLPDDTIIQELVSLKQEPINNLQTQVSTWNTDISTYGQVASQLTALQSVADGLAQSGLQATSVASTNTAFSATTSATAQPGTYSVTVTGLAQTAQSLSQEFSSAQAPLSAGTLTINSGSGGPYTIQITDSMQLNDVASAINASGAPVTATVLNTGYGYYLQVTNQNSGYTPGTDPDAALTLSETTTDSNGASLNFASSQTAANATFTVDNLNYTRQSNVISDAIPGVTLTLNALDSSAESLDIVANSSGSQTLLQNFVTAYNTIQSNLNTQLAAPSNGNPAGPMAGDDALEELESQLQSISSTIVGGTGSVNSLADLGVTTAEDGTLSINATTFNQAMQADPTGASSIFSTASTGVGAIVDNLVTLAKDPTQGFLTLRESELQTDVTNANTQISSLQEGISTYQQQLQQEFDSMETTVSALKNQGAFLTENESLFTDQTSSSSSSSSS
jgi:flagellar hook-associated protein 2